MLKVIETFSGIGSQRKALSNLDNVDFQILNTCEWDINSIIAYCLIHEGGIDTREYEEMNDEELFDELNKYTLSSNGKSEMTKIALRRLNTNYKRVVLSAIKKTNNFVSITDVVGSDISEDVDIFTYSFPCQDLSLAGGWHGNVDGIKREKKTRSGLLWEVERILLEMRNNKQKLPKFLLMENVTNLISKKHKPDFDEWLKCLSDLGYVSKLYTLNAINFGVPQKRRRVFMISVNCGTNEILKNKINDYFENFDINGFSLNSEYPNIFDNIKRHEDLSEILKVDYSNNQYRNEAFASNPNNTVSRKRIYVDNQKLHQNGKTNNVIISTVTTKQDRHPNSGVIDFPLHSEEKSNYRFLTGRECFQLMGFAEKDYQKIRDYNINELHKSESLNNNKTIKFAGNSIVVNVLEGVFNQIIDINDKYYNCQ